MVCGHYGPGGEVEYAANIDTVSGNDLAILARADLCPANNRE